VTAFHPIGQALGPEERGLYFQAMLDAEEELIAAEARVRDAEAALAGVVARVLSVTTVEPRIPEAPPPVDVQALSPPKARQTS
jgi:hypothetical protein